MKLKQCKKFKYRVQKCDDLKSICNKLNTSKENILRNNYNIPLYAGEWVEVITNDYFSHVVKPAQTLEEIAKLYQTDVDSLIKQNNLATNKLYIGQTLKIYR